MSMVLGLNGELDQFHSFEGEFPKEESDVFGCLRRCAAYVKGCGLQAAESK